MTTFKVYCDESRQNAGHRFRLLGSVWIPEDLGWQFVHDYRQRCERIGGNPGHLTFKKNAPPNSVFMRYYEALVDLYFEYADRRDMRFRTIVVSRDDFRFDHPEYAHGDFETGLSQLYYQLLVYWLTGDDEYHIRIADREFAKSSPLSAGEHFDRLKDILNAGFNKRAREYSGPEIGYPPPEKNPVKSVEGRPAKERLLIQLTDILMGAVGYHWNEGHLKPNASAGKRHLAGYIAEKLGWSDLRRTTAKTYQRFNIFHLKPKKQEGRPAA